MTPYPDQLAELAATDPVLGAEVARLRNLEGVMKWIPAYGASLAGVDLVQQDEYSYDFLVPLPDSRWLAFAVT
jgi:hypothetical protein